MDLSDKTPKVYLSERNLRTLLSKLDREKAGEDTACTLIKHQQDDPSYQQTMKTIMVVAVQDDEYYGSQKREAGYVHPLDEPKTAEWVEP